MERQNFEDSWKDAFANAEVTPTENAWRNIELDLERAKGAQLRKSIFYYKMLAAASVILALAVGVGVYVNGDRSLSDADLLAEERTTSTLKEADVAKQAQPAGPGKLQGSGNSEANQTSPGSDQLKTDEPSDVTPLTSKSSATSQSQVGNKSTANALAEGETQNNSASTNTKDRNTPPKSTHLTVPLTQNSEPVTASNESSLPSQNETDVLSVYSPVLPSIASIAKPGMPGASRQNIQVDPVVQMMAKLEQMERELSDKEEKKNKDDYKSEKLWTSVGFAAGAVSATNAGVTSSSPSTSSLAMNKPQAEKEAKASGLSYSFGLNVGTRVSERWVVQGGVNYLTQTSDYTASTAVGSSDFSSFSPQSIIEIDKMKGAADEKRLIATSPYNVNNNIRYLSIPLQAGYLLVNKDFGVQVNAGVSTDLFLQNTITAESESLTETTQRIGDDSPYRSINVSGLVGTEVSYRFGDHYRLALNPGIRYPFSSVYRSGIDVKASPLTLDIGLKFRYIFK